MLRRYDIASAMIVYFILSIMSGVTGNMSSTAVPSSIFRNLLNQQDYQRSDPPRLNAP